MKRVAVVTSASGSGGTLVGREIASRLGLPFHELDALFWQPDWRRPDPDDFRERVAEIVATEKWVVDGSYQSWIGQLVLGNADLVVWLDLPLRVWFPRLVSRTLRRALTRDELWNCNYESLRTGFASRDSLILFALRHFRTTRRRARARFAAYDVVRLGTQSEIDRFLSALDPRATSARQPTRPRASRARSA